MKVRLAFSVAAHLEPEILIVDEVLAVGDAEFQKKCLGKMDDVSKNEGRTILFVSHNMGAVKSLCKRGVYLSNGMVELIDDANAVVSHYQKGLLANNIESDSAAKTINLLQFKIKDVNGNEIETFNTFDSISFHLQYESFESLKDVSFAICFNNLNGQRVTSLWSSFKNVRYNISPGVTNIEIKVPSINMLPGLYEIILYAESNGIPIQRLNNFRNIVIGYDTNESYLQLPNETHGMYMENFSIRRHD
jgi:lipopolysaccharide transport system ATP-binding protein